MLNLEKGNYFAETVAADSATQVQITLAAKAGQRWSIGGFAYSIEVEDTTTAIVMSSDAELSIWDTDTATAGNEIWSISLADTSASYVSDVVSFAEPVKFGSNAAIVIELNTGAKTNLGKVSLLGAKLV